MHRNAASRRARAGAAALVVLLLSAWVPARATASTTDGWDPRIAPIARAVERLRGLNFDHAVPVDFLSEARFKKKVVGDQGTLTKSQRADLERSEHQFRALGLVAGKTDVIKALSSLRESGVLAFYDDETKRVTVRGTTLTVSTRVTLAHELTHVLQDQHFDLLRLHRDAARTNSSTALRALIEGDAVRIQDLYADKLDATDRAAYEKERAESSTQSFDEIRSKGVPDALSVLSQVPYLFGPTMLDLLAAAKGKRAIDALFGDPPTTDAAYLTPTTLIDGSHLAKVVTPALAAGEKRVGKPEAFGAFALFLVLAGRGDPGDALAAADGWGGDRMITFTRGPTTCLRAAFVGRKAKDTTRIDDALSAWAASMPPGAAMVGTRGHAVTLTACELSPGAGEPPNSALGSLLVAATRDQLLVQAVRSGLSIPVAECAANGLVRDPVFQPVIAAAVEDPNAAPDSSVLAPLRTRLLQLTTECSSGQT